MHTFLAIFNIMPLISDNLCKASICNKCEPNERNVIGFGEICIFNFQRKKIYSNWKLIYGFITGIKNFTLFMCLEYNSYLTHTKKHYNKSNAWINSL